MVAGAGRFGPYRLIRELGTGASATVWLAEVIEPRASLAPGDVVALKVLRPPDQLESTMGDRFEREAAALGRIRHPNVVAILDAGAVEEGPSTRPYLALEYVEGESLAELLRRDGAQTEASCLQIARQIAQGLAAIHASGHVHRDIKPHNLLISRDLETVKVMDFGTVHVIASVSQSLTRMDALVGTPLYVAPEQIDASLGPIAAPTDLYALGLVLYELAAGAHPFADATSAWELLEAQMHRAARPLSDVRPVISPFFDSLVGALLAKDPASRIPDAGVLLRVLEEGRSSAWWKTREPAGPTAGSAPRRHVPAATDMRGRDAAMEQCDHLFHEVCRGNGRVVLAFGEGGIGKTRLLDEVLRRYGGGGAAKTVAYGGYASAGSGTALGGFGDALRDMVGDRDLEGGLTTLLADTPRLGRALAAVLRGMPPPDGAAPLDPESIRTAFVRAIQEFAARGPVVLAIDDLQDASLPGLGLFAAVANAIQERPVLLIAASTPDLSPEWGQHLEHLPIVRRLTLERLDADAVRGIVHARLGDGDALAPVADHLAVVSGGVPLYLFALIDDLIATRVLEPREGASYALVGDLHGVTPPNAVLDLQRSRLQRLPSDALELLQAASVIGAAFDPRLLSDVEGRPVIAVLRDLARIERQHRLVRARGERYAFDHPLLREALQGDLPVPLLEELHSRVGDALVRRHGAADVPEDRRGALAAQACRHLLRAGRGEAALAFLDEGLSHLEGAQRITEATDLLRAAVGTSGLLDADRRAALLVRLGEGLEVLGRTEEALGAYEEAQTTAEASDAPGAAARAAMRVLRILRRSGRSPPALLERAARNARQSGQRSLELELETMRGGLEVDAGRWRDAEQRFARVAERAEAAGLPILCASARGMLGRVRHALGRTDEAHADLEACLRMLEPTGERLRLAQALNNLAWLLIGEGRHGEARPYLERSLALSRDLGYRAGEAKALGNLSLTYLYQGRLAEAVHCAERDAAIHLEIGDTRGRLVALQTLGEALAWAGRPADASARLEEAVGLAAALGLPGQEASGLDFLAKLASWSGDGEAAERLHERALAAAAAAKDPRALSYGEIGRAATRLRLGDVEGARAALAAAEGHGIAEDDATAVAEWATCRLRAGAGDPDEVRRRIENAGDGLAVATRIELLHDLWRVTGEPRDLDAAWGQLEDLARHAPSPDAVWAGTPIHRALASARLRGAVDETSDG